VILYKTMKIYYDIVTGERIWDNSYNQSTTIDFNHDYAVVGELKVRVKESIGLLVLENGLYAQDFAECNGYRVNVATRELEFSYPVPGEPQAEPTFQKPLSEQVKELETKLTATQEAVDFLLMGGM
jgi:hypothetical protein